MAHRVVIAGGGIGALEGALALQDLAGDRVAVSVLTPGRHMRYRALSVGEPFGAPAAPHLEWEEIARDRGITWIPDMLTAVDPAARVVTTRDGRPVPYDALLLALGARAEPALPGALSFGGPRDVFDLGEALGALGPGRTHRVAFIATSGTAWTLPLYELALLAAQHGRSADLDLAIDLITPEAAPLGVFGPEVSDHVAARLAEAGIRLRTGTFAEAVEDGNVYLELEGPLATDLAVALPRLRGPAVAGLPHDEHGFVPVDELCRVPGAERVWAVGDMTTRPLKQGGLAAQQADVAAAAIAAAAGAPVRPEPYRPVLQGVLLTGAGSSRIERDPRAPQPSHAEAQEQWTPARKVLGAYVAPYLEASGRFEAPAGTD
jgi:sulfide:quinone oxidoreductase